MIRITQFIKSRIVTIDWDKTDGIIEASLTKRKKEQSQGTITLVFPGIDTKPLVYKDAQLRPFYAQGFYELHANITPDTLPVDTFVGVLPLTKLCIFNDAKETNTKQSTFREAEIRNIYESKIYEIFSAGEIKCVLPLDITTIIYDYESKEKQK